MRSWCWSSNQGHEQEDTFRGRLHAEGGASLLHWVPTTSGALASRTLGGRHRAAAAGGERHPLGAAARGVDGARCIAVVVLQVGAAMQAERAAVCWRCARAVVRQIQARPPAHSNTARQRSCLRLLPRPLGYSHVQHQAADTACMPPSPTQQPSGSPHMSQTHSSLKPEVLPATVLSAWHTSNLQQQPCSPGSTGQARFALTSQRGLGERPCRRAPSCRANTHC
jgi:hypothetical protein